MFICQQLYYILCLSLHIGAFHSLNGALLPTGSIIIQLISACVLITIFGRCDFRSSNTKKLPKKLQYGDNIEHGTDNIGNRCAIGVVL